MNLLTDKLPCSVEIEGRYYSVATDFRDWIRFFDMTEDENLSEKEKYLTAMKWFTETPPEDIERAFKALSDFSLCKALPRCGKKTEGQSSEKPCLSWKYDAPFIIGAFRQVYGIDLLKCKMHWYEFFALFMALPDDTPVKYRMAMRQVNPADIKDNGRRSEIRRIQRAIAIPCGEMSAFELGEAFM